MKFAPHARVARVAFAYCCFAFLFQQTFTTSVKLTTAAPRWAHTNASTSVEAAPAAVAAAESKVLLVLRSNSAVCVSRLCLWGCVRVCECPFVDSVLQLVVGGVGDKVDACVSVLACACVLHSSTKKTRQKRDKNENCLVYFIKSSNSSRSISMRV